MFSGVCMSLFYNYTVHYLVQLALQHINSKTHMVCKVTNEKIFTFLLHIMQPGNISVSG